MVPVRHNILVDIAARDAFIRAVTLLKAEDTGLRTDQLGIVSNTGVPSQPLSTYDLFVIWHHMTMSMLTPPNGPGRNAAHQGPVFLPWHRLMLLLLERNMQRILPDPDFGLPYWDWAAEGEKEIPDQLASPLWDADCLGGNGDAALGDTVTTGPFSEASAFRVRVEADGNGNLRPADRPLRRSFLPTTPAPPFFDRSLPERAQLAATLDLDTYDAQDWDLNAAGFRNLLEGWADIPAPTPAFPPHPAPNLHNQVHVWIGGDMSPSTSPNDPVFYMNHCNVDRIWAAWQDRYPTAPYLPPGTASADLFRHRIDDPLYSIFARDDQGTQWLVRDMLDVSTLYAYDSLTVD
jgi:tyrosinase